MQVHTGDRDGVGELDWSRCAVAFPGQGGQGPRMGLAWRDHEVWELVERAEAAVGRAVAPMLLDRAAAPQTTADAQLAVFMASMLAWEAVRKAAGPPALFAGHSLGQISALTAAGVLAFEDAVRLTARRGELTEAACRGQSGGMVAVLPISVDAAEKACGVPPYDCWVANDNAPGQVVLAGTETGLGRAAEAARALGAEKFYRLAVPGAFHTPLMAEAAAGFGDHLRTVAFGAPVRPVLSNATARPAPPDAPWRRLLSEHLVSPVRWRESQEYMVAAGVRGLVEVGCGRTLSKLAHRTVPQLATCQLDTPAAADRLLDGLS
ncbi:ACP S-malonyltransferase [Streptomyces sp. NPDC059193]|uniref:ACP S-malonyltransferase n=1 Tax=Streptomyces sp. NPDC059193 TaxID=3346763 RepID=UPI0036A9141F